MATTTGKSFCATCKTERGIFTCDGCSQIFCLRHTTDHHEQVVKKLDRLEETREHVEIILARESSEPQEDLETLHDELTKKIDIWEQESIDKIRKAAVDARNELSRYTIGRFTDLQNRLEQLTNELQQSRINKAFVETDVTEWKNRLNDLKHEVINQPDINIREGFTKLISNILVTGCTTNEIFERSSGKADFKENGKLVSVKKGSDMFVDVRGRCEYNTGQHTISLDVEKVNGWVFFGIISASTPLQIESYSSSSSYGWYNADNFVYAAGVNIGGQGIDVQADDTIYLVIDCDNRLIQLINDRLNQSLELRVDIDKCPFPWQLHLNLNIPTTRIRIV